MKLNSKDKQYCPNCKKEVYPFSRYPEYFCEDCSAHITDKEGRRVDFANSDMLGHGCEGYYVETGENYNSGTCFIGDVEYYAEEARFGGIVIQLKEDGKHHKYN